MNGKQLNKNSLSSYSLKEYFDVMLLNLNYLTNIDELTDVLTELNYTETRPYLIRRQLSPIDNRFEKIELVYDNNKKLHAIVWLFKINFNELVSIFGEPILNYSAYADATFVAFKDKRSPSIEIVKTIMDGFCERINGTNDFKINHKDIISNPMFGYIQISLVEKLVVIQKASKTESFLSYLVTMAERVIRKIK